jgi:uncharacterized protein
VRPPADSDWTSRGDSTPNARLTFERSPLRRIMARDVDRRAAARGRRHHRRGRRHCGGVAVARAGLPQPNGRINDFAGVLDEPTRAELAALSAAVDAETTAEIAVATVTSLSGMSVEDYAVKLFAAWGIGKRDKDNGVLVLVAPMARETRIEVGYGLEPILPDGLAGMIVRDQFLPHFREDNYQEGIVAGVQRIAGIVRRNQPPTEAERRTYESGGGILGLIAGLVVLSIPATLVGGGGYFSGSGWAHGSLRTS